MSLLSDVGQIVATVTGLSAGQIISAQNGSGEAPSGLYASIYFKPVKQYGQATADYSVTGGDEYALTETVTTEVYQTAMIQFFRDGANAEAYKFLGADIRNDVRAILHQKNMAMFSASQPTDLTGIEQGDYEERASVEVKFGLSTAYITSVGGADNIDYEVKDEHENIIIEGNINVATS